MKVPTQPIHGAFLGPQALWEGRVILQHVPVPILSLSQPQQGLLTLAVLLIRPVPAVVLLVALPAVGDAVPVPTLELVVPGAVRGFCWVFWQGEENPLSHRVTSAQLRAGSTSGWPREHHPEQHKHIPFFSSPAFPSLTLWPPLLCLCSLWPDITPGLRTRVEYTRAWQKRRNKPCNSEMRLQLPRLAGYSSYSHPGNSGKYWVWL